MFKLSRIASVSIPLITALFCNYGFAEDICKTTDDSGQIIFTECSKANPQYEPEKVDINSQTNTVPLQDLNRELKAVQPKVKPSQKKAPSALKQAKAALKQAKQHNEEAQKIQSGDYMGKAGGGVRISTQRRDRLESAQKAVDGAEAKVKELQ
jgi:hypothetical protein